MLELFPQDHFTTESLYRSRQYMPVFECELRGRTLSKLTRSTLELTRKTLIATVDPRYTPRHTSALAPPPQGSPLIHLSSSVAVYEDGNRLCSRHIFLSTIENLFRWWVHKTESSREP